MCGSSFNAMLDDKKRTMDYSLMAYALINKMDHEGLSALPNAPVVAERRPGRTRRRQALMHARLARVLHQAAWAIEPDPPTQTETRQWSPRPDEGAVCAGPPVQAKSPLRRESGGVPLS
jgi:hypothetical protein